MPALATHYLFGQEVFRNLVRQNRKDIVALIRENRMDYNIGLQGPDLFFYYRPIKSNPVTAYANQIHHLSVLGFMENAIAHIRRSKDLRSFTYMLGFVAHFVLDSEAHPIVNFYTKDSPSHIKLETELDREILLREILKRDAAHREEKYRLKHQGQGGLLTVTSGEYQLVIQSSAQFYRPKPSVKPEKIKRYKLIRYNRGLEKSLGGIYKELSRKQIKESLDSFEKFNKLLYSPTGISAGMLGKLETAMNKKGVFSSIALTPKRYENFVDKSKKLVPVVDDSVQLAADMIINFYDAVRFGKTLSRRFDRSFD